MEIKVIKTQKDYEEALKAIKKMMREKLAQNSSRLEKLELLTTLVQDYESRVFPDSIPDHIDAILFRMEQMGLSQSDLVPFIGSKSKVSEILARKRPLSLNMIRSLNSGLGIPAQILLSQTRESKANIFDYEKFPISEMLKRGYIHSKNSLEQEIKTFFGPMVIGKQIPALLSRADYVRSSLSMNHYALHAWMIQVVNRSKDNGLQKKFKKQHLTLEVLKRIVDLTDEIDAIYKVRDLLNSLGIHLIIEPHLPQTYLDGAAIMTNPDNPIIGMTIRLDRLDNFWFTLLHELAHVYLHFGTEITRFYDDVESGNSNDPKEKEANELALETMIPEKAWKQSVASILPSLEAANILASELSIHPSIVAGKIRYTRRQHYHLNKLVGQGEVRKLFPEIKWKR